MNLNMFAAQALTISHELMAWAIPVGIVLLSTVVGWGIERMVVHWAKSLARRSNHERERALVKALRGHLTFWGFLLGLSIESSRITPLLPKSLALQYPTALEALFIVSLTFMMARVTVALINASAEQRERPAVSLISNVARFVILAIGFMLVLAQFRVDITPWLTALGVGGLAVSLALQATLTDFVSGMLLLGSHQLEVGAYVQLNSGEAGYITDITWRTTTIRQLSNNEVIIPNSHMTSANITNYDAPQKSISVLVPVGVSYDSDLEKVERVTVEVARDVMKTVPGGVPDSEPFIRYNELSDFSIKFSVIMQGQTFTDQYLITHEFIKRLFVRYNQENITIPFPTRTLHVGELSTRILAGQANVNGHTGAIAAPSASAQEEQP